MSITDGHIYLDAQLMHDGILPAVNSGASVSRIGGGIQPKVLRRLGAIAGSQLARYNEVKSYETMNTELTEETEREINRGKRILEFFNQPSQYNYTVPEECILLHIVTTGLIDYVEMELVMQLKKELIDYSRNTLNRFAPMHEFLSSTGKIDDKDTSLLDQFIETFVNESTSKAAAALKEPFINNKISNSKKSGENKQPATEDKSKKT